MAEWESRPLDTKTTKQLVKHEPRRPMAARLKKESRNFNPSLTAWVISKPSSTNHVLFMRQILKEHVKVSV